MPGAIEAGTNLVKVLQLRTRLRPGPTKGQPLVCARGSLKETEMSLQLTKLLRTVEPGTNRAAVETGSGSTRRSWAVFVMEQNCI